ncbi:hypothetical protein PFISCL1PPCAC_15846, partial [Pristionchus fissidentatus]
ILLWDGRLVISTMADSIPLDARRVLARTRVLKSRLKSRVAELSTLIETNKEKSEALADLRLRSDNLVEERRRIESAEKKRNESVQLSSKQMATFDRPPTVGGLLKSCAHDNAKEFIGAVADVRCALMQIFARTAENEKLALTEAETLEETHRDRMKDAAEALCMLRDSADRMQLRVEKRAMDEKMDYTECEKLRLLIDARKADLVLYEAKRSTLQKEFEQKGARHKDYALPTAAAAKDDCVQPMQQQEDLHEQIIQTIARALDEIQKPR